MNEPNYPLSKGGNFIVALLRTWKTEFLDYICNANIHILYIMNYIQCTIEEPIA